MKNNPYNLIKAPKNAILEHEAGVCRRYSSHLTVVRCCDTALFRCTERRCEASTHQQNAILSARKTRLLAVRINVSELIDTVTLSVYIVPTTCNDVFGQTHPGFAVTKTVSLPISLRNYHLAGFVNISPTHFGFHRSQSLAEAF